MKKPALIVFALLLVNFLIRLLVYNNTTLFHFSDYSSYLRAIENIANGKEQYLLQGNFLFAISYIGYFAKYALGNLDYFFMFNCLLGALTSMILYILVKNVTGSIKAGLITIIIHTLYTEFMVFSSVFYTPVLMVFLLSLLLLGIFYYLRSERILNTILTLLFICVIFSLGFFFKPELKYLPYFLLLTALIIWFSSSRSFPFRLSPLIFNLKNRILVLALFLFPFSFFLNHTNIISRPPGHIYSNSFIFFGHTDYGGDGGEGSLIYPENKERYNKAWDEYLVKNGINTATTADRNRFQAGEIIKFVTQHPEKWVKLQFTKFFRTFGIVPEGVSFKILYSGLLKGKLWLTSFVIVIPVAVIIILFILFFNINAIRELYTSPGNTQPSTLPSPLSTLNAQRSTEHRTPHTAHRTPNTSFLKIYLIVFIYYLIAICFFGHYQERYRIPVMVVFIIPALSYFIATFNRKEFFNRKSLIIKGVILSIFLVTWMLQVDEALENRQRLDNVIELLQSK